MPPAIEPLVENDLPKRETSFWKMTGPGALMVGVAIGSGELILWPWITAKFGAQMVWAAALGVFLQLWINIEIGRWAIATGESAVTGFSRLSRFASYYFMGILFISAFLPGWAIATGVAVRRFAFGEDGPGANWVWTALVFAVVFAILFGPKRVYASVERVVAVLVLVIVGGMVIVAFRVGTFSDAAEMSKGLLKVGQVTFDDEFTFLRFFGAVVFAGAGGFGNLFYGYYLRDKGIGMGARIPALANPLRGEKQTETQVGFIYPDTDENRSRFKDWFKYVILDSTLFFWLLNTFTMFLFMFGAFVVLYPQGIVPAENQLVWDLSVILETILGSWGRILFLLIAVAALFSSQLTLCDGSYRLWTDLLHTNVNFTRRWAPNQLYFYLAIVLTTISITATWALDVFQGLSVLDFFFLNAALSGCAMALYVPLLLVLNFKFLPPSARPKPLNVIMVSIGAATYISFALFLVYDKLSSWLA